MGSNSNWTDKSPEGAKREYLQSRATRKDDRESNDKLNADAKLRGSIGNRDANEIIKSMDSLKERGIL